jgi:alpha-L-rhamnosidase
MQIRIKAMTVGIIVGLFLVSACSNKTQQTQENIQTSIIADMTVNYRTNPMNVDVSDNTPVFGWRMNDDTEGQRQSAYRIVVSDSEEGLGKESYTWDSGRVESDLSVAVTYNGDKLLTGTRYYWKVYVWDKDEVRIDSDISYFETGISDSEWKDAKWIGVGSDSYDNVGNQIIYPEQYTVEYDVKYNSKDSDSGFIWGADKGRYGNYYQCEIDTRSDEVLLRIGELYNGEYLNKNELSLAVDKDSFNESVHNIKIEVQGKNATVFVDGTETMTVKFDNTPASGVIGLWTTRGAFYAYYDNIKISTTDKKVICQEDFSDSDNNIFEPYYVKVIDGWCEAASGFVMMSGFEMPAPMLRTEIGVDTTKTVESARIYASALGIYDIYINGIDVCDEYMAPGQSVYTENVYYQTYDITEYVNNESDGYNNAIGVILGHGRYDRGNESWGNGLAFIGKIEIEYSDGTSDVYVTDESWYTYDNGPIRNDDMYDGEYYDSNFELDGWSSVGYSLGGWKRASVFEKYSSIEKIPAQSEPVKVIDEITPISVSEPEKGVYVYDFGQNFNGNCVLQIDSNYASKGNVLTMRYAEWLNDEKLIGEDDEDGTIYTENLYTAKNTDYYVVSGKDNEEYTPTFVYRGFRYVQITGISKSIPLENIKAYVISSDNTRTGYFECSDDNLNSLYNAIYWTQLSNYVDIPTDCPQRDERLGWAGDAQVFAQTASYNSNIYSFMNKYVDLLNVGQSSNGAYPEIAPSINIDDAVNGWSDAGVILVWEMYQQYGNIAIIEKNLEAMCRYVDLLVDSSNDFIRTKEDYGDHNAAAGIDADIIDTAQCAYVALLLSKMGKAVGNSDVTNKYEQVYNQYKSAWQKAYINEDGSIGDWLQSEYVLGLAFGLYPEGLAQNGADCLNIAVSANDSHLNTGYIATQFLLPTLCDYGYAKTAYNILKQDTYPSWNNMLLMGNTTITEGWSTMHDNGDDTYRINGSLNHMALGSVGQWIYEYMLGIKRDEDSPAFKHFYLEPVVDMELEFAQGSYMSMYGEIKSSWRIDGNEIVYDFTIPANTTATVSLGIDGYDNMELSAGSYEYRVG